MSESGKIGGRKKLRMPVINATRLIPAGFLAVIILGAALLMLPWASVTGKSIGMFRALFTATSAVCVTGLTVAETGAAYTLFGQIVILLLIQIGGLGFVSIVTIISLMLGRKITLKERMLIREAMNENNLGGMVRLIIWVMKLTLLTEAIGAALLSVRFIADFGPAKGVYYAVFHSVSAFCNAGFDVLGEGTSVSRYASDPLVMLTLSGLILTGGFGFGAINDIITTRRFSRFRLHTKLVIVLTVILTVSGTAAVLALEWNNPATLEGMTFPEKLLAAFFQSVTFRTAGFFGISQAALEPSTKFIGSALMFIGAGPASTGGGMKVTTVALLALMTHSIIRGKKETTVFGRTIPQDTLRRAMAIFMMGLLILVMATAVISALHPEIDIEDVLFETASALCTVGLTSAGTVNFCAAAQAIIIVLMYIGRIGPLTLTLAVGMRQQNAVSPMRLPEENVTIG